LWAIFERVRAGLQSRKLKTSPELFDTLSAALIKNKNSLFDFIVVVDGNSEDRSDAVSVFNGPSPTIRSFKTETEEIHAVCKWMMELIDAGKLPHEFGVFVRSPAQLDRARSAVKEAGLPFKVLDVHVETTHGHVSISTMHPAKGLEFRSVVVMACDDEIIPLQERCRRALQNVPGSGHFKVYHPNG
jgi:superfamily I DNA/RNA helicase